jgi:hypothetical protein
MAKVKSSHDAMLKEKREELLEVVRQCMEEIHTEADGYSDEKVISDKADAYYMQQKEKIAETESLALMEGFPIPMWNYRDDAVTRIAAIKKPQEQTKPTAEKEAAQKEAAQDKTKISQPKNYKPIFRQSLLKSARLESEADIDAYVDKLREQLKALLKGTDGIELK